MSGGEEELIRTHFRGATASRDGVWLGIGDDAALLRSPTPDLVAASCDTLIGGVHFPADAPADAIGHRALAVNLSDMAAVGAAPAWALLSLTVPEEDPDWLRSFSRGFAALADRYCVALVGGDTTRGPLSITVTALGRVAEEGVLCRGGAQPGDGVWVTGTLGDAALGLACWCERSHPLAGDAAWLAARLLRPEPRIEAGRMLAGVASAAIDLSDGLALDLSRLLEASGVGAVIDPERLPASASFRAEGGESHHALHGGDDYELCFTLPPAAEARAEELERAAGVAMTRIGTVDERAGLRGRSGGSTWSVEPKGYDHFGGAS